MRRARLAAVNCIRRQRRHLHPFSNSLCLHPRVPNLCLTKLSRALASPGHFTTVKCPLGCPSMHLSPHFAPFVPCTCLSFSWLISAAGLHLGFVFAGTGVVSNQLTLSAQLQCKFMSGPFAALSVLHSISRIVAGLFVFFHVALDLSTC